MSEKTELLDSIYLVKIANGWLVAPAGSGQLYGGMKWDDTYFAKDEAAVAERVIQMRENPGYHD